MPRVSVLVSGEICNGTKFRMQAYTWKHRPEIGVRFNLLVDEETQVFNMDAVAAVAYLQDMILTEAKKLTVETGGDDKDAAEPR